MSVTVSKSRFADRLVQRSLPFGGTECVVLQPPQLRLSLATRTIDVSTARAEWRCNACEAYKVEIPTAGTVAKLASASFDAYHVVMEHAVQCFQRRCLDVSLPDHMLPLFARLSARVDATPKDERDHSQRGDIAREFIGDLIVNADEQVVGPAGFGILRSMNVDGAPQSIIEGAVDESDGNWRDWVCVTYPNSSVWLAQMRDGQLQGEVVKYTVEEAQSSEAQTIARGRVSTIRRSFYREHQEDGPFECWRFVSSVGIYRHELSYVRLGDLSGTLLRSDTDAATGQPLLDRPLALEHFEKDEKTGFCMDRRYNKQGAIVQRLDGDFDHWEQQGRGRMFMMAPDAFTGEQLTIVEGSWAANELTGPFLETNPVRRTSALLIETEDVVTHRVVNIGHPCMPSCGVSPSDLPPPTAPTSTEGASLFDPVSLTLPADLRWMNVSRALDECRRLKLCSAVASGEHDISEAFGTCGPCNRQCGRSLFYCTQCLATCHANCKREADAIPHDTAAAGGSDSDELGRCECALRPNPLVPCICQPAPSVMEPVREVGTRLYALRSQQSPALVDMHDNADFLHRAAEFRRTHVEATQAIRSQLCQSSSLPTFN